MAERVIGIDFSGAEKAGQSIWLAEGRVDGGQVRIERCRPASAITDSGPERSRCLPALVAFIAGEKNAIVGCDFPFSLPAAMIEAGTWRAFAMGFGDRFAHAEDFLADCRRRANGREIKRACDRESRVPFAAYNLRIYRQTYYGIRDVLAPLLRTGGAVVLPMERPQPGRPWVIEICPASTLKHAGLYPSYKGRSDAARAARRHIVNGLTRRGLLAPLTLSLRRLAIDNQSGDALDSIVAAVATGRACLAGVLRDTIPRPHELVEGRVYY